MSSELERALFTEKQMQVTYNLKRRSASLAVTDSQGNVQEMLSEPAGHAKADSDRSVAVAVSNMRFQAPLWEEHLGETFSTDHLGKLRSSVLLVPTSFNSKTQIRPSLPCSVQSRSCGS
jgi:hypothetical protein